MSNLLFMDESNGNGVYATKPNNSGNLAATATAAAASIKPNNIDNIMAVTTTNPTNPAAVSVSVAASSLPTSVSNEDLSQSLSEYTDADESISAPTEFLAEFLSAVMLKNYKKALKYCNLILQYEPNNATAKDFYPLILEKLNGAASSDSDENYNKSSSPDIAFDTHFVYPSPGESDDATSDDQQQHQQQQHQQQQHPPQHQHQHRQRHQHQQEQEQEKLNNATDDSDDCIANDEIFSGDVQCSNSSGCSGGVESLSSVSMDEDGDEDIDDDEDDVDVDVEDDDVDDDDDDEDEVGAVEDDYAEDAMSSSGDDLPIDDANICLDNAFCGLDNASHSSHNSSSGAESGRSRSDNTTHSYSSLLLEDDDDDILPTNMHFTSDKGTQDLDVSNGNKMPSASCSDSESPTEPLTQRLAAILLSKCGVSSNGENF